MSRVLLWVKNREKDAEFFGFLGEQLVGTEDVRANGATGYVMWQFYHVIRSWLPINRKATLAGYSMWMSTLALFAIGNALAFLLGAYLWSTHVITIGTVYLIFYYTNLINQPMEQIRMQLQELQQFGASIERVQQLAQLHTTIRDGNSATLPNGPLAVDIQHVSFGYNEDDTILHDLSIHIQPGKVLGILGRTGSGKTTIARLLLRLYDPQQGSIRLSGVPIRELRLHDLRTHIGMVTQDVQLFHASVRDNLTFFNRTIPDERILTVIDDLGLSPWYRSLPQGLATELGSDGEGLSAIGTRGVKLSGGQAQRAAAARMFVRDTELFVFDDLSSALDVETEQLLWERLFRTPGRTCLVVSHRRAVLQRADSILVLKEGRVEAQGTLEELLQRSPEMQRLWHNQTSIERITIPATDDRKGASLPNNGIVG